MKIEDLYSNLNEDMSSISKRKKQIVHTLEKWSLIQN